MLHIFASNIVGAEIINDEDKHDWPPLVFPDAWRDDCLKLPFLVQSGANDIIW